MCHLIQPSAHPPSCATATETGTDLRHCSYLLNWSGSQLWLESFDSLLLRGIQWIPLVEIEDRRIQIKTPSPELIHQLFGLYNAHFRQFIVHKVTKWMELHFIVVGRAGHVKICWCTHWHHTLWLRCVVDGRHATTALQTAITTGPIHHTDNFQLSHHGVIFIEELVLSLPRWLIRYSDAINYLALLTLTFLTIYLSTSVECL